MRTRTRTAMLAAASALLIAILAPLAIANTDKGKDGIWRDDRGKANRGDRFENGKDRFPRGPRAEPQPGETAVAPVPEPGTMSLLTLGLVSLAAGLRKRRAGRPTVKGTAL